jgi:hypothetical protein
MIPPTYLHTPLEIGDCVSISVVQPIKSGHVTKNYKLPVNFPKKSHTKAQPNKFATIKINGSKNLLGGENNFPKCRVSKCPR